MPVYNPGKYLNTAVQSILSQSLCEIELILVDDGSTDGSSELCDKYAQQDSRVIVIHQKNSGICVARNVALKIVQGEYVGFSDHDDVLVQGALECAYNTAKKYNADIVKFEKKEFIYRNGRIVRTRCDFFPDTVLNRNQIKDSFFQLKSKNLLNCIWDGLFRRELVQKHSLNKYFRSGGEDIAYMYSLITETETLVLIDKVLYYHYIRRGFSTSTKFDIQNIEAKRYLAELFNKTLYELDIDKNKHKLEYSLYLIEYYLFPIIAILSHEKCPYPYLKKMFFLKKYLTTPFVPDYILNLPIYPFYNRKKRLGIGYFLLKYKFNWLLFKMFNIRGKFN